MCILFQVNICPQDSVTQYNFSEHGVQPTSLPAGVSTSGIWFCDPPMSLPTTTAPFTSNLPHFNAHYDQVQNHHQQLQQQLSENIRTFLQRHEENQESPVSTLPSNVTLQTSLSSSIPSLNQVPSLSTAQYDGGASDSSRSYLFSSLRLVYIYSTYQRIAENLHNLYTKYIEVENFWNIFRYI